MPRIYTSGQANPSFKTGLATKGPRSSLYNSWCNMKARCLSPKNPKYHRYGGRGVTICPDWLDIRNFRAWALANGWRQGLQIDRINNDGDYSPSNCRWVTASENARRKSTTKLIPQNICDIRLMILEGKSDVQIAKCFSVTPGNIYHVRQRYTHRHVR